MNFINEILLNVYENQISRIYVPVFATDTDFPAILLEFFGEPNSKVEHNFGCYLYFYVDADIECNVHKLFPSFN